MSVHGIVPTIIRHRLRRSEPDSVEYLVSFVVEGLSRRVESALRRHGENELLETSSTLRVPDAERTVRLWTSGNLCRVAFPGVVSGYHERIRLL